MDEFEVAYGSVMGTEHARDLSWKNNQDALKVIEKDDSLIAIVCDGCGSEPLSEVGANIGAGIISKLLYRYRNIIPDNPENAFERIREYSLLNIRSIAPTMGDLKDVIQESFLFTVVGALITPKGCWAFSVGDGLIILNGGIIKLGPFPNNEPPYLVYKDSKFQIHERLDAEAVKSILIGTDGALDLLDLENSKIPGRSEAVGPINQFWENDNYFSNPDAIRRKLALINKPSLRPDWDLKTINREHGLLKDDTTIVVIRQKKR